MRKLLLAVTVATMSAIGTAMAQVYPSRPVTLIVPFEAGGAIDVIARVIAEGMGRSLGQTIIIENVVGAAGRAGLSRLVGAAPDGYTFGIGGWGPHVAHGALYALKYDLLNDFEPVSLIATQSLVIVSKTTIPADDLKGLIAWLKANPDKAVLGAGGVGTPGHVSGVLFKNATGTRFQIVPYQNASKAMQDMVAGRLDMQIATPVTSLPPLRAGTIKAFAVTNKKRLEAAPEIPTVDEAGLPGFYASNWQALWAPKNTPGNAIARLNTAVAHALADPVVRRRFVELGQELYPGDQQSPNALRAFHRAEIDKWSPVIKAANIKIE